MNVLPENLNTDSPTVQLSVVAFVPYLGRVLERMKYSVCGLLPLISANETNSSDVYTLFRNLCESRLQIVPCVYKVNFIETITCEVGRTPS